MYEFIYFSQQPYEIGNWGTQKLRTCPVNCNWQSWDLNPGSLATELALFPKLYNLSRRGQVHQGYSLDKNVDSTFSQRHPSFHGTYCPGPVTVLPSLLSGTSFAKNIKELCSHNSPLTSVKKSCKNIQGSVLELRGWNPNPTFTTNWLGVLESLNASTFRFFISKVGIMSKAALRGFCEEYMS